MVLTHIGGSCDSYVIKQCVFLLTNVHISDQNKLGGTVCLKFFNADIH